MFYYGLDFHDLAPNFILNISAFIIVCEAFLRIPPHFSLWLKTFNVKPKVVSGQQAGCGGTMVGKIVPTVRVYGRRLLVALEKQLPGIFVSGSEEPHQGLVLLRIELPQRAASVLARKDPADQHHLDDVKELDVPGHYTLNARLQRYQLVR